MEQKAESFDQLDEVAMERFINQQIAKGWLVKYIVHSHKFRRGFTGIVILERQIVVD